MPPFCASFVWICSSLKAYWFQSQRHHVLLPAHMMWAPERPTSRIQIPCPGQSAYCLSRYNNALTACKCGACANVQPRRTRSRVRETGKGGGGSIYAWYGVKLNVLQTSCRHHVNVLLQGFSCVLQKKRKKKRTLNKIACWVKQLINKPPMSALCWAWTGPGRLPWPG